jgi:hypothetical protein
MEPVLNKICSAIVKVSLYFISRQLTETIRAVVKETFLNFAASHIQM